MSSHDDCSTSFIDAIKYFHDAPCSFWVKISCRLISNDDSRLIDDSSSYSYTLLFTTEERLDMLRETTKDIPNVEVDAFDGLLNEYAAKRDCHLLIRGLRAFSDFEYEFQRALMIKQIAPTLETAFFMTDGRYSFLSSTGVRELAHFNGDVSKMVPPYVQEMIHRKMNSIKK